MKLILESWRKFVNEVSLGEPTKDIEYTAFVLEDNSSLLKYAPQGWDVKAHHMTIIPPTDMKRRLPQRWLDFSGCLKVVGIAQNDKVVAALVDLENLPLPMKIQGLPHITIAINKKEGGKAAMSNEFTKEDFEQSPVDFKVCGKVEEVSR